MGKRSPTSTANPKQSRLFPNFCIHFTYIAAPSSAPPKGGRSRTPSLFSDRTESAASLLCRCMAPEPRRAIPGSWLGESSSRKSTPPWAQVWNVTRDRSLSLASSHPSETRLTSHNTVTATHSPSCWAVHRRQQPCFQQPLVNPHRPVSLLTTPLRSTHPLPAQAWHPSSPLVGDRDFSALS